MFWVFSIKLKFLLDKYGVALARYKWCMDSRCTWSTKFTTDPQTDVQYGGKKRKADDEVKTPEKFYTINEVRQVKAKKYCTTAVDYSVHFNDLEDLDLVREYEHTQQIFEQLLTDVTKGMQESDLIRFVFRTDQLDKPISLPFMPVSRLTSERVFFSNWTRCTI